MSHSITSQMSANNCNALKNINTSFFLIKFYQATLWISPTTTMSTKYKKCLWTNTKKIHLFRKTNMPWSLRQNSTQWQRKQSPIPPSRSLDFVYEALPHLHSASLFYFCGLFLHKVLNLAQCVNTTSLLTLKSLHKSFLNKQGRNTPGFTQLESLQDSSFQNKTEKFKTCFSPRSECNYLLSIISQQRKAQLENCGEKIY